MTRMQLSPLPDLAIELPTTRLVCVIFSTVAQMLIFLATVDTLARMTEGDLQMAIRLGQLAYAERKARGNDT